MHVFGGKVFFFFFIVSLFLCGLLIFLLFFRDSLLLKHRTRDRKVASSNPGRSGGRIFFSRVNSPCYLLFGVRLNSVLQQWHIKEPGHSAKKVHMAGYT